MIHIVIYQSRLSRLRSIKMLPVHNNTEVGLPGDVNGLGHHNLADRDALGWGLLRDQLMTNHGGTQVGNLAQNMTQYL